MRFSEKIKLYLETKNLPVIPEISLNIFDSRDNLERFGFSLVDFFGDFDGVDLNLILKLYGTLERPDMWDVFQFFFFLSRNIDATLMLRTDIETILNFGIMPFGWESHKVGIENVLIEDVDIEINFLKMIYREFGLSGVSLSLKKNPEYATGFLFGEKKMDFRDRLFFKEISIDKYSGDGGVILKMNFDREGKEALKRIL